MIVAFYSQASYAGKDTCADFAAEWCRERDIACERDAFAWDGKVVAADALGIQGTREEKIAAIDQIKHDGYVRWCDEQRKLARGMPIVNGGEVSGRDFLIGLLGDPKKRTGIRGVDEKFWTGQVLRRAREFEREHRGFTIISDLRFVEESESVWYSDGVIVEVVRHGAPTFNEQTVPYVSHVVRNDSTIEQLRDRVCHVMHTINRQSLLGADR